MMSIANRHSVMLLYSERLRPIDHCVRLVLAEKDISVEIHYADAENKPLLLDEYNPYGNVLTLIDRELVLYSEQIMMEYLDERFPHPPLLPVDPVTKAENRQFRFRVFEDLYSLVNDIEGPEKTANNARKAMRDNMTAISPMFEDKPYFMSEEYTLVDCCMAPLLWRLSRYGIRLPSAARALEKYADRLFAREAFKKSLSDAEKELN